MVLLRGDIQDEPGSSGGQAGGKAGPVVKSLVCHIRTTSSWDQGVTEGRCQGREVVVQMQSSRAGWLGPDSGQGPGVQERRTRV